MRYRPHYIAPTKESVHLILAYKDFGALANISHIGLGVAAMNNAKILDAAGFWSEIWALKNPEELIARLVTARQDDRSKSHVPISHVCISAAWIPVETLAKVALVHNDIMFTVTSHSNVGFLQADPNAFTILRGVGKLQTGSTNIRLAANCETLITWWDEVYKQPMLLLPNMYDLSAPSRPRRWRGGHLLRIGCFGAIRPLKNLVTAGAAALEIATRLGADLEFYVSSGRVEGGAQTVMNSLSAMYANLPNATLKLAGWTGWPDFRSNVRHMDLLLLPSYTESFSMVTADGVAEGVPTVCSDVITWVPRRWVASGDNASDLADVGIALLHDPTAAEAGLAALKLHNQRGLQAWSSMLLGER